MMSEQGISIDHHYEIPLKIGISFVDLKGMVTSRLRPFPLIGPNRPKRDGPPRADLGIPQS